MGTPIPPPIIPDPVPPGDPCDFCWGPGQPFGVGPTPESILITVFGIGKGPNWIAPDGEPVEGEFTLTQDSNVPCLFSDLIGAATAFVVFTEDLTVGLITAPTTAIMFAANPTTPCITLLVNETNDHFAGGTMTLTIPTVV